MIRVITTNPTGGGYDITDLIDGLTWSSTNPGGDERAGFNFKRSWFAENPEVAKGSTVRIEDGLARCWTGRIEEVGRGENETESLAITAYGPGNRLKDNMMSSIYADRELSVWQDPSRQRRINLLNAFNSVEGPSAEWDSTAAALTLTTEAGKTNPIVEGWYDAGSGNLIGSIYYDMTSLSTASFVGSIGTADDDVGNGGVSSGDLLTGASSSAAGTFTPGTPMRMGLVQLLIVGSVGANDRSMSIRNLIVFGNHGLAKRGSAGSQGFFDSDIVNHVINATPGISTRQVDAGSFVITQSSYREKVRHEQIIGDVSQFENRDWGTSGSDSIFDTSGDGQFDYKLKDGSTRHWTVSRADVENPDLTTDITNLFDTAIVKFTDESGKALEVIRTAVVPDLVAAGVTPKTIDLDGGIMTLAGAQLFGDIALAITGGFAPARGSLVLKGTAFHHLRGDVPVHRMKADGSNLQVRGILPSSTALGIDSTPDRRTTFPIKRVSVDASGPVPAVTVDLDQNHDRLTQLQNQLAAVASRVVQ